MYYSSFGILAVVIHFIINFHLVRKQKDEILSESALRYRLFLVSVVIYYVTDILWGTLYEKQLQPFAFIDTVCYFSAMVLSVLLWTRYVVAYLHRQDIFARLLTWAGWVIFTYEFLNLIVNFFYPVVFKFEKDGEYVPGIARYVTLWIQVLLFAATSVYVLVVAVKSTGRARLHHSAIGVSGIVMTIFILLQSFYPLLPFYAIGCMIATCIIHTFVEEDERRERDRELGSVKQMAFTDSLTGVKNMHAYLDAKKQMDQRIINHEVSEFGVVIFDLNGLKYINDTKGHEEGDRYIREASMTICKLFKHSPVYRIGGDEFAAILEGEDYERRVTLLKTFEEQIDRNQREDKVVVSSGIAVYIPHSDGDFNAVFERADHRMYERKKSLKAAGE